MPQNWRPSSQVGGRPGEDDRISLAAWLAGRPSQDPFADPDGDGINQLLAFSIGANETLPARAFLPFISLELLDVGGRVEVHPVLQVRERIAARGVAATIEDSLDLQAWIPAALVLMATTDHGDGSMTKQFRVSPAVSRESKFFRLRVKQEP